MHSTTIRKKVIVFFVSGLLFASQIFSQGGTNVGVNTATPEAALDINGDIIIRTAGLTAADGITLALDVNTVRFSNYRITGPTADFTLAGITAGIDGRLVTLFNLSGFTMQLNNEDANAAVTDMIVTGTNADITIVNKGIVSLQYDGTEQKWIVKSSSKGAGAFTGGYWDTDGSNIHSNNTGNVGIGTIAPEEKLTVQTLNNSYGISHRGEGGNILSTRIGGTTAGIGTFSPTDMRIFSGGVSRMIISQLTGEVFIGTDAPAAGNKLTVQTLNNSYGISHIGEGGNILSTRIGGTSAGIGTFSNTHMRIFCNSQNAIFIAAATGNVGIGTENFDTYKLAVNGSIRAKEIRINTGWADYVFEKNYKLKSLPELEQFIKINKRLPGIPSASKLKKEGVDISDMQTKMMAKIEELTLYLIEAYKTIEQLKQRMEAVEKANQ